MFEKLKQKWGVNGFNLTLILITFAIGGSICGRLARYLLGFFNIEAWSLSFILLYVLLMTLLWPISVISVSILTGQFRFFKNYLAKIARRIFKM
ncbi:MAG: DUF6787 family protein [Chitinophagales bacterium]